MPDHDEIAAAERLRRVKAGEGLVAVYDHYGDMPGRELDKWTLDRAVVADAYLARPPLTRERVAAAVGELFRSHISGKQAERMALIVDGRDAVGWAEKPMVNYLCRLLGVTEK